MAASSTRLARAVFTTNRARFHPRDGGRGRGSGARPRAADNGASGHRPAPAPRAGRHSARRHPEGPAAGARGPSPARGGRRGRETTEATLPPMAPMPTMPTTAPSISRPVRRGQPPCATPREISGRWRQQDSISPTVSSATPVALAPCARSTAMPRCARAARGRLSTPVPLREMTRSPEAASITAGLTGSIPRQPAGATRHQRDQLGLGRQPPGGGEDDLEPPRGQAVKLGRRVGGQGPGRDEDAAHGYRASRAIRVRCPMLSGPGSITMSKTSSDHLRPAVDEIGPAVPPPSARPCLPLRGPGREKKTSSPR